MRGWRTVAAMIAAGTMVASVAGADVKAGVDAWAKGDFKRAVEEWRPLAIAGDADAEFNLGQAYKLGRGVPLDPALARSWFLKAANQGHLQAADNYGLALFESGQKADAAPWLEKSVARGEPRAELVYGTMLFNGDGVPRDYPRAYALMTRASQQGLKSASETLAQMDQYISAADRQRGTELAERYAAEQTARRVADVGGGANGRITTPVATATPLAMTTPPAPSPVPPAQRPAPAAARPTLRPAPPTPHPAPPASRAAVAGGWRVQLGAFRDAGNAHALWSRVGARVGGSPAYVAGGGVTRLQAGPFASRAAAQHACTAAGGGCVVVAP